MAADSSSLRTRRSRAWKKRGALLLLLDWEPLEEGDDDAAGEAREFCRTRR